MRKIAVLLVSVLLTGCHKDHPSDPIHDTTVTNLSGSVVSDSQSIQIPNDSKIQGVSTCDGTTCLTTPEVTVVPGVISYLTQVKGGNTYVVIYQALVYGQKTWNISVLR